jgi:hypothetical protein
MSGSTIYGTRLPALCYKRGAKPKVTSEALGHASVGFTIDVYFHIIEKMRSFTVGVRVVCYLHLNH